MTRVKASEAVRWGVAANSPSTGSGQAGRFAVHCAASHLRVERGWAARELCYFQQGGGNLCCQRGNLNKDPAGALIYATRQTTQDQCRCKRSQGFVRRVCSALAAALATHWRAKL
jgi:hypothetical protein